MIDMISSDGNTDAGLTVNDDGVGTNTIDIGYGQSNGAGYASVTAPTPSGVSRTYFEQATTFLKSYAGNNDGSGPSLKNTGAYSGGKSFATGDFPLVGYGARAINGNNSPSGIARSQALICCNAALTDTERADVDRILATMQGGLTYTFTPTTVAPTTMSAGAASGANTITVQPGHGITTGKTIIIPSTTGYGTFGPGGILPAQSGANEAAILALTTSTPATRIRSAADGKCYDAKADGTGYQAWDENLFYTRYATPLAWVGTVTVSGNTLTLSSPLQAAVPSGTSVFHDSRPELAAFFSGKPNNARLKIGAGSMYLSRGLTVGNTQRGWWIEGAGKTQTIFYNVRGARPGTLQVYGHVGSSMTGMKAVGQHRTDGGMTLDWSGPNDIPTYGSGFTSYQCTDPFMADLDFVDVPLSAVQFSFCYRGTRTTTHTGEAFAWEDSTPVGRLGLRISGTQSEAHQRYINWLITDADCYGKGEWRDCSWTSTMLIKVFETWRSDDTTRWTRFTGTNCIGSVNSAKNPVHDTLSLTLTAGCRIVAGILIPIDAREPLMNMNSNVSRSSGSAPGVGGTFINPMMDIQGWTTTAERSVPVFISDNVGYIEIMGTYIPGTKDDGLRKGYFRAPYTDGAYNNVGGPWLRLTSQFGHCSVDGVRIVGFQQSGGPTSMSGGMIQMTEGSTDLSTQSVTNTISGTASPSVTTGLGTYANNVSNAAYTALP